MGYAFTSMLGEHRRAVIDILNHYVEHSFAAYPETRLDYSMFDRLMELCTGYAALVATASDGAIAGFGLLRAWHHAPTLSRTAEVSYFLAPGHTGMGLGTQMLGKLIEIAKERGVDNILASVSSRNRESIAFHLRNGFVQCGDFKNVGRKFGEDFGVLWFQRRIA